jgi:hypothetical protein
MSEQSTETLSDVPEDWNPGMLNNTRIPLRQGPRLSLFKKMISFAPVDPSVRQRCADLKWVSTAAVQVVYRMLWHQQKIRTETDLLSTHLEDDFDDEVLHATDEAERSFERSVRSAFKKIVLTKALRGRVTYEDFERAMTADYPTRPGSPLTYHPATMSDSEDWDPSSD